VKADERRLVELMVAQPLEPSGYLQPAASAEWWRLALAMPPKRLRYLIRKWNAHTLWDYGTSDRTGWFDDGIAAKVWMRNALGIITDSPPPPPHRGGEAGDAGRASLPHPSPPAEGQVTHVTSTVRPW
jgi:hypothetical protein